MKKIISILLLCIISCNEDKNLPDCGIPNNSDQFPNINGTQIIDGNGNPIWIKGVAFGNDIWDSSISATHHSEVDYQRVKDMKMNAIRFYLAYDFFENDNNPYVYKQSGWDWLDQNIAWAKKYGIYLILNMHKPQGGYQSQGQGDNLWTIQENQNRLASLWKAIANKYKDEKIILGYGLVNEPVPTENVSQWNDLANKIISNLREVDKNHLLFVERAIFVKNKNYVDTNLYFPNGITDNKVVYEFHCYDPYYYTHQKFTWSNLGDGGAYPDESIIDVQDANWASATFSNPGISTNSSGFENYEGQKFLVNNSAYKVGVAAIQARNLSVNGSVEVDDIEIKEFDANNNLVKIVYKSSIEDLNQWSFWAKNSIGNHSLSVGNGIDGSNCIKISGTTEDANSSHYGKLFEIKQNHYYQISGKVKTNNLQTNAEVKLRVDFFDTNKPIYKRNKAYLESVIKPYVDFAKNKQRPVYMGEFGAGVHCFKDNKGGIQYVNDMIDIIKDNKILFTYHAYHEDSFGLYFGYGMPVNPSNANEELINLFKTKF